MPNTNDYSNEVDDMLIDTNSILNTSQTTAKQTKTVNINDNSSFPMHSSSNTDYLAASLDNQSTSITTTTQTMTDSNNDTTEPNEGIIMTGTEDTDVISSLTGFHEQDRLLPIANVYRIMRIPVGDNCKISKEAKELMQQAATEFIAFIASEASDRCYSQRKKIVGTDDLLRQWLSWVASPTESTFLR